MPIHIINAMHTIDTATETHYAFHQRIDPGQFPQVHDFYEIDLVTSGCLQMTLCDKAFPLPQGALLLVRPGDVHTKAAPGPCTHVNLAFPAETVKSLFHYLFDDQSFAALLRLPYCPPVFLNPAEQTALWQKMERLRTLSPYQKDEIRSSLRLLLADVMKMHLLPSIRNGVHAQPPPLPPWLKSALEELEYLENFSAGMTFLLQRTKRSKEHIGRTFKRCLGTTPSAYIYSLRLNYVANMLTHSATPILELAYEAGFQSSAYFYQLFKQAFHTSPQRFREGFTLAPSAQPHQEQSALSPSPHSPL
ncbi:MAG: AraC family transcriptional regulator [Candidatus Limiplasma sp.]|nr:AraC family transcriptional regulator [Candidatus Limiplasma sp.]